MKLVLKSKKLLAFILAVVMIFAALPSAVVGALGTTTKIGYLTVPLYNSTANEASIKLSKIRALAQTLTEGFKNFEEMVDIKKHDIHYTEEDVDIIITAISGYMPECFHIEAGFSFSYDDRSNQIVGIIPSYAYTKNEYQQMMATANAKANEILADIKGNDKLGDVEKALLIHDRIALLCEYDYENYLQNSLPHISHTMYGVLGNKTAVCQGYALAYGWLLDKVGIKNEYVSSDELNHAWNIVYIDGKPYHVDVTNDDPVWDITGRVLHKYFLCSTDLFRQDHSHDAYDYTSTPTDTTYDDYLWRDSRTAFALLDDELYYICNVHDHIMRYSDNTAIYDITSKWWANEAHTQIWADQARLDTDGDLLLFSLSDGIYTFDPKTGNVRLIHKATLTGLFSIYGFTYDDGYLIYDLALTPNFDENTKKLYEKKVPYDPQVTPPGPAFDSGDVNGDDKVTLDDVVLMAQSVAGWTVEMGGASPDVNGDNAVTLDDVVLLAQFVAGWTVTLK